MDILDTLISTGIGIFFIVIAVVQYRWGAKEFAPRLILNNIFVWFCGIYGFVILYGVVRGLM